MNSHQPPATASGTPRAGVRAEPGDPKAKKLWRLSELLGSKLSGSGPRQPTQSKRRDGRSGWQGKSNDRVADVRGLKRRLWHHWMGGAPLALFVFCCTGTEKAVQPLGFGPLAKAEEAKQEQLLSQRQQVNHDKKSARAESAVDFPMKLNGSSAVPIRKVGQGVRRRNTRAFHGAERGADSGRTDQGVGLARALARQRHDPLSNPELSASTRG